MDYAKTVGKKLSFKGDTGSELKRKKRKKKKKKKERKKRELEAFTKIEDEYIPTKQVGKGRIITSGTSVMGQGNTRFLQELTNGDCIIVQHPTSLRDETRIVTMVLSNMSISISSPFSTDLISGARFEFIKAPPKPVDLKEEKRKKKRKKLDEQKAAFGTYANMTGSGRNMSFTYRVKKAGLGMSYDIITETTGKLSREQLLNKRSKKKSDRMCSL